MKQRTNSIRIEMLSTGDEVLYGQILDSNAAWLSDFLFHEGILITARHTVGDNLHQLSQTLQERTLCNDILIVNGGLGPTSDDLTAQAAANANNEMLLLNQQWLMHIEHYYLSRGKTMPASNVKQAMLPQSASVIDNPIGTACGFKMQINGCQVFFTPGVPSEFQEMMRLSILPQIKSTFPILAKPLCYRLTTMGRTESDLASEIEQKLDIPSNIVVGYRAAMPIIEIKLTGLEHLQHQMDQIWAQIKQIVADNLLYEGVLAEHGEVGLAEVVAKLLHETNQTLIVIEQQSAGMIGYQLFQSDAPVVKSEVVPILTVDPESYLLQALKQQQADIALGIVNFREKNSQFMLMIATAKQVCTFNLKYTGRAYNRSVEQRIFSAIALDSLRRFLLKMPEIVGKNAWLDIIN